MRATLIVPTRDNHNQEHWHLIREIEDKLLLYFGAFTAVEGYGADLAPDNVPRKEQVIVFTVTSDDTRTAGVMRAIAHAFKVDAKQDTVYLAFDPSVTTELVT